MTIKPIVRLGTQKLSQPSVGLMNFSKAQLDVLLKDMLDTMIKLQGVGIAAPQIGVYQRVIMFGFEHNERYPAEDAVPFTILINPSFEPLADEKAEDWEGCLSIPGLRGKVSRFLKIKYSGYDPDGNLIERTAEGFHARVVQHECDHVNGVLYPQRMNDMSEFGFEEELGERLFAKSKKKKK
jgi:peptide deformylase